ncbi:DUF1996 domain-containing protein [Actinomadura macrotermitis]|uniref:DUF1996 domain-containing protein n=1 Tax=Actinomadura macrotermitis TaxID=2585200 RepID=A0A7K0BMU0_9ACTN|nr:DUF1996 domain-containing protein [Actinomadura macrotermitis]MQY02473.1 hypothetical protein [Actinomadura macrotermitis]
MLNTKGAAVIVPALLLVAAAAGAPAAAAVPMRPGAAVLAGPTPPPDDGTSGTDGDTGRTDDGRTAAPEPSGSPSADGNGNGDGDRRDDRRDQGGERGGGQEDQNDQGDQGGQNGQSNQNGNQGVQQVIKEGPDAGDFADIRSAPRTAGARPNGSASRGSFTSRCGRNQNGHHNPDNFIVAPGVSNGAHHIHDYVGNLTTDGFSTDQSLAAGGTTCARGDRSAYFWPVLRLRAGQDGSGQAAQSAKDGNVGKVVTPRSARMQFLGNPGSKVTAMPRFMRIITGDAKAGTNGTANAHARWTCSGFGDRAFTDKYPLCPGGSRVTRVLDFPSCWDGRNTDSANHRTHVVFPDGQGRCPGGTKAIPQLRMTLEYDVPAKAPAFAVDSFPEQGHDPVTDHADFENVMPAGLMRQVVSCLNGGRGC